MILKQPKTSIGPTGSGPQQPPPGTPGVPPTAGSQVPSSPGIPVSAKPGLMLNSSRPQTPQVCIHHQELSEYCNNYPSLSCIYRVLLILL